MKLSDLLLFIKMLGSKSGRLTYTNGDKVVEFQLNSTEDEVIGTVKREIALIFENLVVDKYDSTISDLEMDLKELNTKREQFIEKG